MSQFDLFFWKDFASNGLATLLGALIGIPIALGLDRYLAARRKAEERQQEHILTLERKLQFIESLEAAQKAFASFEDWLGSKLAGKDVTPIFDF